MYGLAGYVATAPKIKGHKGVAGPDTHRINAGGGPKDTPRSRTRQSIDKERAQLARGLREEDYHG